MARSKAKAGKGEAKAPAATPSSSRPSSSVPDPRDSLNGYLGALQGALVPATRNVSEIPTPEDMAFNRSIDRKFAKSVDEQTKRVDAMIQAIVRWAADSKGKGKEAAGKGSDSDDEDGDADDADPAGKGYARIADVVDHLLEQADTCLDEYTGKRTAAGASDAAQSKLAQAAAAGGSTLPKHGKLPPEILNAQIDPPQRNFTVKPDNRAGVPWDRPLAFGKPNAQVPLDWRPPSPGPGEVVPDPGTVRQGMYCAEGDPRENPYYYEIFHAQPPVFVYAPPTEQELQPPPPLDEEVPQGVSGVPFTWIDTASGVEDLARHLEEDRVKEIAIDLEAHAYRSFQGIACLMQLSTRWGDYILDLCADPVRQTTEKLNKAFTDPDKVKILHGAEHDILWLQRDCGLYLVNLFDTYHATNVLPFPAHGLAYLLTKYWDFEADKRYQLADWRIRPLPKEMMYYARSDTHALIYIYHRLRAELLNAGGKIAMDEVFNRSKVTAARRYAKEVWDEEGNTRDGWRSLWKRMGGEESRGTDARKELKQMGRTERLVRRLHLWRDDVAREEDESPRYILSAANLINLASRAPMTRADALKVLTPGIPPVRKRASEVARIIKEEILAWEQDQKEHSDKAKADMDKMLRSAALDGADADEDLGSSAVVDASDVVMADAGKGAASSASLTAPMDVDAVLSTSLWEAAAQPAARPVLRSKVSSLFGQQAGTSLPASPASAAPKSKTNGGLQKSLSSALRGVIGSMSSLFGPAASQEQSEGSSNGGAVQELPARTPAPAPVDSGVEASFSVRLASGGKGWRPDTESEAQAQDDEEEAATTKGPVEEQDEAEDRSNADGIVQVKKKNKKNKKQQEGGDKEKVKWTNEKKRKAREERAASSSGDGNGDGDPAQSQAHLQPQEKKAKVVTPFDYASTPSILDAPPPPPSTAAGAQAQKKVRKGKRDRQKEREAQTGPERFADARQPRDRTEIKGAGRSLTFS